ncbi:hypothetical protein ACN38_g6161 [Penicillium nordicum]|uniref:Uncharacterized protein n=1 Tax=Penicillium nordicum TaxID=229535 RepID=A0A0M8P3R0_9EURO|nr:hypothetical protein ACN38_g6161 [Penicillium nordicum]
MYNKFYVVDRLLPGKRQVYDDNPMGSPTSSYSGAAPGGSPSTVEFQGTHVLFSSPCEFVLRSTPYYFPIPGYVALFAAHMYAKSIVHRRAYR